MPKIFQILACVTQGATTVSKYINVTLYQVLIDRSDNLTWNFKQYQIFGQMKMNVIKDWMCGWMDFKDDWKTIKPPSALQS